MSEESDTGPDTAPDSVEKVERTDFGCSMEARMKRGTGTRDEDSMTIKSKGETAAETIAEFYELLEEYEQEISDRLRDVQPGEDEAGD
ncbi:hypothetical protein Har1130_19215 [Haloarcula sp. CBA1130]|uniref:DUF7389 domain-containing protein n=1 Tax=unclassified Haloarcula TaxID=2624677 RepID=UPI0012463497|nr:MULTISPECIES: hypothetical protein [unclassified Haloarcula]KAA9396405.1 hypothetical protein Har1130_19215 [Haloarcula sp. CBA1130]KAA9397530.1 hypothetical protein Har1129_04400 [Haloarcula sp. CBA1129]